MAHVGKNAGVVRWCQPSGDLCDTATWGSVRPAPPV